MEPTIVGYFSDKDVKHMQDQQVKMGQVGTGTGVTASKFVFLQYKQAHNQRKRTAT